MKEIQTLWLLAMCLSSAPRLIVMDPVLQLEAGETIVKIQPLDRGRKETRVPDLNLSLVARFNCPEVTTAESVTISVADTHQRFIGEALAGSDAISASVIIPADQIAPITNADFCIDGQPSATKLQIPGIATAHASLRCRGESLVSMHYTSTVLPLSLVCETGEPQVAPAPR